ncbi:MAG: tetratricopeptide repeat protein [Planctomycetota bacterium]
MAGKVNVKFVAILVSVLAVVVVGGLIVAKTVLRQSVDELVAEGDRRFLLAENTVVDADLTDPEAVAEARAQRGQEYRFASQSYGQAWNRDPQNVELLLKYIDARGNMTVRDQFEAKRTLSQIMGLTRQATELRPEDEELLEAFYQTLYRWAREFKIVSFYNDLFALASTRLEDDPDNTVAIKFRAIAQAVQISDDIDRSEQQSIREDLERVLEVRPEDTDVLHFLARWHLYDAGRYNRAEPGSAAGQEAQARALAYSTRALDARPDDLQVKVEHLTVLMAVADSQRVLARRLDDPAAADAANARFAAALADTKTVLDQLEASLLQTPEPPAIVQRVAEVLPRMGQLENALLKMTDPEAAAELEARVEAGQSPNPHLDRTERLLRVAASARPDMLLYRVMLANVLKLQLKLDDAHEIYVLARDHPIAGNYEASLRDQVLQQQAVYEVANIELIRAEAAEDPDRRAELLADADRAVDDLEKVSDKDARVLMLRGKIALLRNQTAQAMVYIDRASDLYQGRNIEALLLSARARQAEKQWGAAAERLQTVLDLVAKGRREDIKANIRLQLAEMLIRSRDLAPAREQISITLEAEPNSVTAKRLLAQWYAVDGQPDKAIETLESLGMADDPQIAKSLARLYGSAGDAERERELLTAQFQSNPTDVALLQALLPLAESDDERSGLLDQAEAAGANSAAIELFRLQIAGRDGQTPVTLEDLVDRIDRGDGDELSQALRKARIFLQYGQLDRAREAYEAARGIDADADAVLVTGFDLALRESDFPAARSLANEAGKRNLDLADGHFLRGRLAAAEGNLRQALASYDQGLKLRPVFDEGWRQLAALYLRSGDTGQAVNAYRTALDQKPDNVRALTGLANTYRVQGRHNQALETLRTAVNYAPRDAALRRQYLDYEQRHGDPETVIRMRREIAESQPQDIRNRISLAITIAQDGDPQRALADIDEIEAENGVSRETVGSRAAIHRIDGQDEAGEQAVRDYLASLGEDQTVQDLLLLARYQLTARRINQSVETYRQAIAMEDAATRPASRELADMLFNFGQNEQAAGIYEQLFERAGDEQKQILGARLAEALLRIPQADRAVAVLDQLEESATTDALRAVVATQRGDAEGALGFINRSLGKNNRNAITYLQRARLRMQDPETLTQALDDTEQALSINPDLVQALELKAQVQRRLGQPDEARFTLRDLLETAPGNNAARAQLIQLELQGNRQAAAEELIEEGLELDPDNPNWLQFSAAAASARGDTAAAIATYEQLLSLGQPNARGLAQLAGLYLAQNQPDAVDQLLSEHPEVLAGSPVLQGVRGQALAASGQRDAAVRVFSLALERSQSAEQVSAVFRAMVAGLGPAEALSTLDAAGPLADATWGPLAAAAYAMSQRDYDAALARLEPARQVVSGSDPQASIQLERLTALALLQSDRHEEARDAYLRLLELTPDSLEVLNNLAFLLANDLDDAPAAVPMAERAAELNPNSAEILDTLGWTYYLAGRVDEARRVLEDSIRIRPLPANTLHLGRVYVETGDEIRARNLLNQATELALARGDEETVDRARRLLDRLR